MSVTFKLCVVLAIVCVQLVRGQSSCQDVSVDQWNSAPNPMRLEFGLQDGVNGTAAYVWELNNGWWTGYGDYYLEPDTDSLLDNMFFWINQTPLQGGLNMTYGIGELIFTPTANFTCDSESSGLWGPAYPDYRENDFGERGRFQNIQVYIHYSAPNETSYIRQIVFIKNIGTAPERVELWGDWWTNNYAINISPVSNEGRYYTGFPFQEGDEGQNGDDPASTYAAIISSVHIAGPRGRDQSGRVTGDYYNYLLSPTYHTTLAAGQEFALMVVTSFGVNRTLALSNAAAIDAEPADLFHGLTADQLAMIRNWGGCEVILAPTATVSVTAPSQCSNGLTSDFTVSATSTRTDLTSGFTHRVIGPQDIELVAGQSSTTLAVPNGVGSVKHQLWYKECLVKETAFDACAAAAAPTAQSAPVGQSTSGASSIGLAALSLISAVAMF